MKIRDLLNIWEQESGEPVEAREHCIKLPVYDAAKLAALAELYPGRSEEQLLTELISAALDELQAAIPYIRSDKILTLDEEGDPIYADGGLGPRFHELTERHLKRLKTDTDPAGGSA